MPKKIIGISAYIVTQLHYHFSQARLTSSGDITSTSEPRKTEAWMLPIISETCKKTLQDFNLDLNLSKSHLIEPAEPDPISELFELFHLAANCQRHIEQLETHNKTNPHTTRAQLLQFGLFANPITKSSNLYTRFRDNLENNITTIFNQLQIDLRNKIQPLLEKNLLANSSQQTDALSSLYKANQFIGTLSLQQVYEHYKSLLPSQNTLPTASSINEAIRKIDISFGHD